MPNRRILNLNVPTYLEYRCGTCYGDGKNPYGYGSCSTCEGTGLLIKKVKPGNYLEVDCGPCDGSGHNPYGHYTCSNCGGTGKLLKRLT